jgi:hypothetical protein
MDLDRSANPRDAWTGDGIIDRIDATCQVDTINHRDKVEVLEGRDRMGTVLPQSKRRE